MSKRIQLSISDPCHESWDAMTPSEQGRFCAACRKQVIDFTGMSDAQLVAFFRKPATGSTCGRFYQDQLDRDIEIPKKRIPWVKYFFQFALPAFLASAKASAQGNVMVKKPVTTIAPSTLRTQGLFAIAPGNAMPVDKKDIRGRVMDESNNPVSYASIVIKGTKLGVIADSAGMFRLDKLTLTDTITLQVSCVGFMPAEVVITKETDPAGELLVRVKPRVLDEVVVKTYSNIRMGGYLSGAVCIVKTSKYDKPIPVIQSPAEKPAMIKIYPNPVLAGTSINIGCEKLEEGYYIFQLFSQAGQQIVRKQIWIDAEARIMNMEIPAVPTGSYFLILANKETGKKFTEKILIQ